ncbi:STAS domain-containing protein [Paraburkholderia sp. J10-1]|uniref:STAS domain-containing protein n=1 Tax=Paraburkholderia sp. J10-1 TaxID=2805430 RepID=UPI002AB6CA77|nr:STAS domain-containing protein [Paraburkholderia sp. J10-1]
MANQFEMIGTVLVACLQGKLNSTNAEQTEAQILQHINRGTNQLVIDLGELDYISSAGLRVVLVTAKRLKQSAGQMALCGISNPIREVFEISGFFNILDVAESREQALSRFNQTA